MNPKWSAWLIPCTEILAASQQIFVDKSLNPLPPFFTYITSSSYHANTPTPWKGGGHKLFKKIYNLYHMLFLSQTTGSSVKDVPCRDTTLSITQQWGTPSIPEYSWQHLWAVCAWGSAFYQDWLVSGQCDQLETALCDCGHYGSETMRCN